MWWYPNERILQKLQRQAEERPLSYEPVGLTKPMGMVQVPDGWFVNQRRTPLGKGRECFDQAVTALKNWQQFNTGWSALFGDSVRKGQGVVVVAKVWGNWTTATAQVLEVIDEPNRFVVIYGTTMGHPMRGEERFQVDLDDAGQVTFDLASYSRPARCWLYPVMPIVRRLQRRFAVDAGLAMQRSLNAVNAASA